MGSPGRETGLGSCPALPLTSDATWASAAGNANSQREGAQESHESRCPRELWEFHRPRDSVSSLHLQVGKQAQRRNVTDRKSQRISGPTQIIQNPGILRPRLSEETWSWGGGRSSSTPLSDTHTEVRGRFPPGVTFLSDHWRWPARWVYRQNDPEHGLKTLGKSLLLPRSPSLSHGGTCLVWTVAALAGTRPCWHHT